METDEQEFAAMLAIVRALEPLTEETRRRVLVYILERFAVKLPETKLCQQSHQPHYPTGVR